MVLGEEEEVVWSLVEVRGLGQEEERGHQADLD